MSASVLSVVGMVTVGIDVAVGVLRVGDREGEWGEEGEEEEGGMHGDCWGGVMVEWGIGG